MNNFKDYGFEADFEGEILKKIIGRGVDDGIATDRLIGFIKNEYGIIEIAEWWNDGILRDTCKLDKKYNLKPIKKEWYENADNFPTLVVDNNKKILYVNKYQYIKENNTHWVIYEEMGEEIYSLNLKYYRPATKEEVLSLLVKE